MIELIGQPRTLCPVSKSRHLEYIIRLDEHIIQPGAFPFFSVEFQTTGAANGETIEIAGVTFTVDDSAPFTNTTWSTTGTTQEVAQNFMDMLLANYRFIDFQFLLSGSEVQAFSTEAIEETPWTFDASGMTITVVINETNGNEPVLKNMRIWYQVFNDGSPVGRKKVSDITYEQDMIIFSTVNITINEEVDAILTTLRPPFIGIGPFSDTGFYKRIELRYGIIEFDEDCNETYHQVYRSNESIVTNTVFQLHKTREFRDHCPLFIAQVRFLSCRPASMLVCSTTYEWIRIWLEFTDTWLDAGPWRVRFTFFDEDDTLISVYEQGTFADKEVKEIGIGPSNPGLNTSIPADTAYYTIAVYGTQETSPDVFELVQYSEELKRTLITCNCKAAEVYFLEDTGGWQTLVFKTLQQRSFEAVSAEHDSPFNWFDVGKGFLYTIGARNQKMVEADQVFLLGTDKVTEANRASVEEALRSPEIYIRTTSDIGVLLRRIIVDRETTNTFNRGQVTKIFMAFRFNAPIIVHE